MKAKIFLLIIYGASLLAGCSEGGTGGTGVQDEEPILSYGVISDSSESEIAIQSTRYTTTGAHIRINRKQASGKEIKTGMIAKVQGVRAAQQIDQRDDVAISRRIDINNTIRGPISEVSPGNDVVIFGHVIRINADTYFNNSATAQDLSTGMTVSVMGFVSGDGQIFATYIDTEESDLLDQLSGHIKELDKDNYIFYLGSVEVNYASVYLDDETIKKIDNGAYVEVHGTVDEESGVLNAIELDIVELDITDIGGSAEIELEGYVASVVADGEFIVLGTTIKATDSTVIENGGMSDIQPGVKVAVKGVLQGGYVQANKIEISW